VLVAPNRHGDVGKGGNFGIAVRSSHRIIILCGNRSCRMPWRLTNGRPCAPVEWRSRDESQGKKSGGRNGYDVMINLDDDDAYIDVVCLSCFADLKVPVQYAGTSGKCKHCGAKIDVPRRPGTKPQLTPDKKTPAGAKDSVQEYGASLYAGLQERWQFLASIFGAAIIGAAWSLLLARESTSQRLFLIMAVSSFVLFLASLYFTFGGRLANGTYMRWGLNEDFRHNIPLDALNIILGVLAVTHFIPIAPFLLNLVGFFRPEPDTYELAVSFLCFGMFPLVAHSFLRRGNRLALGITTLFFVVVFVGIYFYVANTSTLGEFHPSYFVEIRGFAPFLYWALSGVIYVLAIAALYYCWRDADK